MRKQYFVIIWSLLLILTLFFIRVIPTQYTSQIWTVVIFDILVFTSQLITWYAKNIEEKETFYKYPTIIISSSFLAVQFLISIVVAIANNSIPFKTLLIINFTIFIVMWIIILSTMIAKGKIKSLDFKHKNHHIEL